MIGPPRRTDARGRQAGYAILAVSMIGLVVMLSAAALVNQGTASEAASVEADLLRLRAYWAAMGHASYAFSRGREGGLCGGSWCNNDSKRADSFDGHMKELRNAGPLFLLTHRVWTYDEIGAQYYLNIDGEGIRQPESSNNESGLLSLQLINFADSTSPLPLIAEVGPTLAGMRIDFCVGHSAAGDPCESVDLEDSNTNGIARILAIVPE